MGALTGKVAVVIGGHSGFGEAIVQRFHREGAQIAIAARRIDVVNAAASAVGWEGLPVRHHQQRRSSNTHPKMSRKTSDESTLL